MAWSNTRPRVQSLFAGPMLLILKGEYMLSQWSYEISYED